jgi:branched-chain amino acid transport system substrate-binding protein
MRIGRLSAIALAFGISALPLGCGGSPSATIEPRVATSAASQELLSDIQRDWRDLHRREARLRLLAEADAFLVKYPKDAAAPLVRMMFAVASLRVSNDAFAERLIKTAEQEPEGASRDLRELASAVLLRRKGNLEAALDLMRPLVGKVVDPVARMILLEEVSLALFDAHLDFEAIATMDAWLQDAQGDEHERVKTQVTALLKKVPFTVLDSIYRTVRAKGRAAGYSLELRRALSERMSEVAVERGDASLARWLLEANPNAGAADPLQDLAASTRGIRSVRGRTIGIVLPGDDTRRHDDAAELVRGVSWALGLPAVDAATRGGIRLVTRSAGAGGAQLEQALEELAGEGAGIIITGFDPESSLRALTWATGVQLSVIALSDVSETLTPSRGIIVGESFERELKVIEGFAGTRARKLSVVESHPPAIFKQLAASGLAAAESLSCDAPEAAVGAYRFPTAASERRGTDWFVEGSPECLQDLALDFVRSAGRDRAEVPILITTLETGLPPSDLRLEKVHFATITTGILPVIAKKAEDEADSEVRAYRLRFGARPTYWSALGRDAGVLAKRAISPLPLDTATKEDSIYQRRAIVEAGLVAARLPLWSSDAKGVNAKKRIERTLAIRQLTGVP